MLEIRRILCPTDFSDASEQAVEQAGAIAGWFGAPITVLHVVPPPRVLEGPVSVAAPSRSATLAIAANVRTALSEATRPLRAAGLAVDEQLIEDYDPAVRILERAASLPADLLVIGTHGRTGLNWLLLGSVTDHVLRRAPCPVLTVPPAATAAVRLPWKHILCPVDFSLPSLDGVSFALRLAQESDAELTLLHTIPSEALSPARDTPEHRRRCAEDVRHRLAALVPGEAWDFCQPRVQVIHGTSYRAIVDVAAEEPTDLIVMGVGRHTLLDRLFVGSTTNQVIRHATCPVLTVRR